VSEGTAVRSAEKGKTKIRQIWQIFLRGSAKPKLFPDLVFSNPVRNLSYSSNLRNLRNLCFSFLYDPPDP
jgi:hypothetical protein